MNLKKSINLHEIKIYMKIGENKRSGTVSKVSNCLSGHPASIPGQTPMDFFSGSWWFGTHL